ncbi:MAG: hypothetical protein LBR75_02100 [Prevotellaceae bacterium]|jgi:uncharacterized membrane protein|nr:hypothetical protein [Prevotellaceae bacterium]
MTVVSKFRFEYIASGILGWAFVLLMANLFAVVLYSVIIGNYQMLDLNFENFEFTTALLVLMAIVSVACYVFYFVFAWRLLKMTVTEDEIMIKNIFTGTTKRIIYAEITNISGNIQMNTHGGYAPRPGNMAVSSTTNRVIRLIDGVSISYNNNTYENFRQLDNFIFANWNKNR